MGTFCGACNAYNEAFEIENVMIEDPPTYNFNHDESPIQVPIKDTKVKPPFSKISSFVVAAEVLSFMGFLHEAQSLLSGLNHNSRTYKKGHEILIQNAVKVDNELKKRPLFLGKQVTTPNFDLSMLSNPFEWPNYATAADQPNGMLTLTTLHIRTFQGLSITGIQMFHKSERQNEIIESPQIVGKIRAVIYSDQHKIFDMIEVFKDIDGYQIKVVGMKVYKLFDGSIEYYGIRFYKFGRNK